MFRSGKFRLSLMAIVAAALAFYILKSIELKPILLAASGIGWPGFLALCFYQLGLFVLLGSAWCVLTPTSCSARAPVFVWARMVRDATSELLPFSHLGGIVLGARAAISRGVPQTAAFGSIVVDVTAEMLAQIAFTAAGIGILLASTPHVARAFSVAGSAFFGLASIIAVCGAFVVFQRYGRSFTAKLTSRLFPGAHVVTEGVLKCIQKIYSEPGRVGLSVLIHCTGWVVSALSTWIVFLLMGVRANIWAVLAIESLVGAVRSVAFWVPNGLGVQEVAYATIAPLFGVQAEIGLAVSFLRRAREIAVGIPILLLWQWTEGRKFLHTNRGAAV